MTVTPGQLYILQEILASSVQMVYGGTSADRPSDAPFDYDFPAFRGLVSRGLATVRDQHFYHITDSGRAIAERYLFCPACSKPVRKGARLPRHKCPHKVFCAPAAIERDSRLWYVDPALRDTPRSRDCARCNAETDFQMRNNIGPRHRIPRDWPALRDD